ncbi:hypothetical protein ACI2JA_03880 [Alkalihalobacillus sp. NPDC078783]
MLSQDQRTVCNYIKVRIRYDTLSDAIIEMHVGDDRVPSEVLDAYDYLDNSEREEVYDL